MLRTKKRNFSEKKGPCGHAEPQQSNFSPKKGPCGHAEPQPSHFSTKKYVFFTKSVHKFAIYFLYIPLLGPYKGGGHPSLGIPITEQTRNAHVFNHFSGSDIHLFIQRRHPRPPKNATKIRKRLRRPI